MSNGMGLVLKKLEAYLKAVAKFQSGKKGPSVYDNLNELDDHIASVEPHPKKSNFKPNYVSENFTDLIKAIKSVEFIEDVVPYTAITKLIYRETRYNEELYDTLEKQIELDWGNFKTKNDNLDKKTIRVFLKIKEHVGLSTLQRSHINDRLNEQLTETLEKLRETESKFENLSKDLSVVSEEAHSKADQLVVQFITILGIFAAIMMGAFGSFQGFTSIFSNAENIPIGKTLIISAAGASGVSLILFLLLHSISKLTTFTLSNCDCKNKRKGALRTLSESLRMQAFGGNSTPECTCSLFNKYPTIFITNYLLYYIAFTGFVFMYFNFKGYFEMKVWIHLFTIGVFYMTATIILIFGHRYIIDKNSNERFLRKFISDIKKTPTYFTNSFRD